MATTKTLMQWAMEEDPIYEGATAVPSTGPHRISTAVHYPPVQEGASNPEPQLLDRGDELRGYEGSPSELVEAFAPTGSITMRAYFNSLTWLLQTVGFTGVFTAGNGIITDPDAATIPTGASRWVFNKRTGAVPKTMQLIRCWPDYGVFTKTNGVGVNQLGLNAAGALTAGLTGLYWSRIADPNLTPAYDAAAIAPALRGGFTIPTWLTGSAEADDFTVTIDNPLSGRLGLGQASYFPSSLLRGDNKVIVGGTIPKFALATADIDRLLDAGTFAAKAKWTSRTVIGATAYKYTLWLEMPAVQIVGGTIDPISNRPRFGANYNWRAAWDETAGYDSRWTLVNSVTAANLETLP